MPMITPALRRTQPTTPSSSMAASSSSTATLAAQPLPPLPRIPLDSATVSRIAEPVKKIASEEDVERWKQSEAYSTYLLFLQRVCEASVGKPTSLPTRLTDNDDEASPVSKLIKLLYDLDSWTDDIEPQSKPQRFGNLAFRDWGARLAERIDQLHADLLPQRLHPFVTELRAYLLDAFGSFTRIDYGSGHELAFFAWVCMLYRLGFFGNTEEDKGEMLADEKVEADIGLRIFPLYLLVVWRLQDRYGLEPAGSHGVWGLDDFQFLPYVLGAAQLRTQSALRPSQIVAASSHTSILKDQLTATDPATLISLPLTLPRSLLITSSAPTDGSGSAIDTGDTGERAVVTPNLYLTSLLRIQVLKRGPFHEHSPLLHDIATTVPNWVKVHMGMLKMYTAECMGKKVVVQHFPFGGVGFVWDDTRPVVAASASTGIPGAGAGGGAGRTGVGMALGGMQGNMGSMGVPTARVTRMPGAAGSASGSASGSNVATGRLGHALGLGPRPGQTSRPAVTGASQAPSTMVPPLRMPAPTTTQTSAPNTANLSDQPHQNQSS
ncbi:hypothetical protein EX895_000326 [Sporisorium graminicola]|uniref:Serine/threonine-protein phosphatase 2A activator n=1 Tax=Sporisorium graminicola TaxID=280036 RepID=A0A4U7L369_9BASI|nr:hypothetical protein EX895_000326 [Sporisorium graminicola]TKY90328.1 hypothetical protein EX895_000326 [Sporisorium graminicola]